jgi:hypothetical protein
MLEWISEAEALPPIAEKVLLAHPRQSGEVWDIETARLLARHEDVRPLPIQPGGQWPTDFYWSRCEHGSTILVTGNGWWARLDRIVLPPGAEQAYGPAGLGGGHYVRQIGAVFIPQGRRE